MTVKTTKTENRARRHAKIRSRVFGTATKPRLSVFKSNKHISAQLIDDSTSRTIFGVHSSKVAGKTLIEKSLALGKEIATKSKANKIETVVFDRGGFKYTGAVKLVAEGAREGGLLF